MSHILYIAQYMRVSISRQLSRVDHFSLLCTTEVSILSYTPYDTSLIISLARSILGIVAINIVCYARLNARSILAYLIDHLDLCFNTEFL